MFTVHADGLIAADVLETPATAIKAPLFGLFGGGGRDDPPALEDPAEGARLSKSEAWWRDHVAQFREWAQHRYGVKLDRREALVLMGVGHPSINTIPIDGVDYMLATPPGIDYVDDGNPMSYHLGIVQPGRIAELTVRGRPRIP